MVNCFANAESCFTKGRRLLRVPNALELRVLVAILVLGGCSIYLWRSALVPKDREPRGKLDRSLRFIGAIITSWLAIVALLVDGATAAPQQILRHVGRDAQLAQSAHKIVGVVVFVRAQG